MTKTMFKTIGLAAVLVTGQYAFAQEDAAPPEELMEAEVVAEAITARAVEFGADIDAMRDQLASLPDDLAGAEQVFDDMIAEVRSVISEMESEEGGIAPGVMQLESQATEYRDFWRTRCEEGLNARDCARVELWEEEVGAAVETTQSYNDLLRDLNGIVTNLESEKIYVVDDMRLRMFAAVRETIDASLLTLTGIKTDLESLSAEVSATDDVRVGN